MDRNENRPLVSVVIAAWNAEDTILRTVRSVLEQDCPRRQVVVVDDGSTDRTAETVERLANPDVLLLRQENAGAAAARNRGWRASSGDYIHFLDADDVLLPGGLRQELERAIASGSHPCYTYGGYDIVDETGRVFKQSGIPDVAGDILDRFLHRESLLLPTVCLLDRAILEETGGFDEEMRYHEDRVFFLRVAKSYPAVPVPLRIAAYTQSERGKARRTVSRYTETLANHRLMLSKCEAFLSEPEYRDLHEVTYNSLCARFMLYGHLEHARRLRREVPFHLLKHSPKGFLTWLGLRFRVNLLYPARRAFILFHVSFKSSQGKSPRQSA